MVVFLSHSSFWDIQVEGLRVHCVYNPSQHTLSSKGSFLPFPRWNSGVLGKLALLIAESGLVYPSSTWQLTAFLLGILKTLDKSGIMEFNGEINAFKGSTLAYWIHTMKSCNKFHKFYLIHENYKSHAMSFVQLIIAKIIKITAMRLACHSSCVYNV